MSAGCVSDAAALFRCFLHIDLVCAAAYVTRDVRLGIILQADVEQGLVDVELEDRILALRRFSH